MWVKYCEGCLNKLCESINIWHVRLSKTRSLAAKFVSTNKVRLNGAECKPAREVSVGDLISIQKNNAVFTYKIKQLTNRRLGTKLVPDHVEDMTPQDEIEKYKTYQLAQRNYRKLEHGKPSKKDRRNMDHFLKGR